MRRSEWTTGALAKGDKAAADAQATAVSNDPKGNRQVKSVLLVPILLAIAAFGLANLL